jgi:hypothetical protein
VSCTRPLFDFVVRTRVLAAAASGTPVEVIEGAEVTGLLGTRARLTTARRPARPSGWGTGRGDECSRVAWNGWASGIHKASVGTGERVDHPLAALLLSYHDKFDSPAI